MSDSRRKFLQKVGLLAGAFSANNLFSQSYAADIEYANKKVVGLSPDKIATDEDYWAVIQQSYTVNPKYHQFE